MRISVLKALQGATKSFAVDSCSGLNRLVLRASTQGAFSTGAGLESEENIQQIRARIFGTRIGTGLRSGAKILRKKLVGEKIANYYPTPIARNDPMFVSLPAEAKKAKLEKLKRRGKGPPPKGQGKRSSGGKRK